VPPEASTNGIDLLLSSGFLAFARHVGVLGAIEETGVCVEAICGTSSGALVAAMWAAGRSAQEIEEELRSHRPVSLMALHLRPWRGLFSTRRLQDYLKAFLPATFEELRCPLWVGVTAPDGRHRLLHAGELVPAVTASCAIPRIFAPVQVGGQRCCDGGASDRLGIEAWRRERGPRPRIVHRVARTYGTDQAFAAGADLVIESEPSGASFWSLGDVEGQVDEARRSALAALGGRSLTSVG
jgi:predicted acylesterase/phospholipase RssA